MDEKRPRLTEILSLEVSEWEAEKRKCYYRPPPISQIFSLNKTAKDFNTCKISTIFLSNMQSS